MGRIVTATGWTIGTVDEMGLDDVDLLFHYWRTQPPVHEVLFGLVKGLGGQDSGAGRSLPPKSRERQCEFSPEAFTTAVAIAGRVDVRKLSDTPGLREACGLLPPQPLNTHA